MKGEGAVVAAVFAYVAQGITTAMAVIRWFITDHQTFWKGAKELIWALIPVLNFFYVWDWWLVPFAFLFSR